MTLLNPEYPIVLGLSGKALTGKTCTADAFVPIGPREVEPDVAAAVDRALVEWEHTFFALPLKRMATARTKISGEMAEDRVKYEILSVLLEVFGASPLYGAPGFDQLVRMVNDIATYPMEEGKPRTFLQYVGTDVCRAYDPDCWVNWMTRNLRSLQHQFEEENKTLGVVISDLRFVNEAKMVHEHPNGVVIRFSASDRERQERALARDKRLMSAEQLNHASEREVDNIPAEWVTDIDTTGMSIYDQVMATQEVLYSQIEVPNA